jgi:hypothetical protein
MITFVQYQKVHDVTREVPIGLWINLAIFCFLAIKTGKKITSQLDLFLKEPISSYHRRTTLPKSVEGSILMIDLKNSEQLFRQGAEMNHGGSIMSVVLSSIWSYFKQEGLIIIQGEGDSILALWEKDKNDSSEKILKTILGLDLFMRSISENLMDNGVSLENSIFYRAAITEGAVKPIWREIEKEKIPTWIEAGDKNVFVDASRLLAIEKELIPDQNKSSLIVTSDLAEKYQSEVPYLEKNWEIHRADCISKHGKKYIISIFNPYNKIDTIKSPNAV